jgi:hypothetical protein
MGIVMTLGFIILYRLKELTSDQVNMARQRWSKFKSEMWPSDVKLLGEYGHAYGSDYNGFFLVEAPTFEKFQEFYSKFRDYTRWYVQSTKTITGVKE